jgi:TolA-binding protein
MPKLVLLLIPILTLVLFGLTACGDSDSQDRITALEKNVERLEETSARHAVSQQDRITALKKKVERLEETSARHAISQQNRITALEKKIDA